MGRFHCTGLLYSQPSLLHGFARVLDLGGTFDSYDVSETPGEADWLALVADWYAVSSDLLRALEAYRETRPDGR